VRHYGPTDSIQNIAAVSGIVATVFGAAARWPLWAA
jgi:hypothetical protein